MNDRTIQNYRFVVSKETLVIIGLVVLSSIMVFIRMLYPGESFSFDYNAYISIIKSHAALSYAEIVGSNLNFPYTLAIGIVPIEFGFSLLVKTISSFGFSPERTFAIVAAVSVGLRVYTMRSLGMPVFWILWINIFAITLLEANALRLGIATSVFLFGLLQLQRGRIFLGLLVLTTAPSLHLQVVIFIIPFLVFYFFPLRINRSKLRITVTLVATSLATVFAVQFLSMMSNEKVQEYLARGASGSAGVSVTSILSILLLVSAAIALRKSRESNASSNFFTAILLAFVPSLVLFVFLTNVAVIGDRAWQLGILVFVTFFFSTWARVSARALPLFILMLLTLVIQINVLIRYPLSNFFSPPFPPIDYPARY